jgi:integrase
LDMATKLSPGQSLAMRVILLTGMRRAEGALLKRGELTLNELENSAEIVLSPERTKIHREHRVWCSPLTTSLIQEALEISKHPHQVFTNQSPKIGVQPGHLSKLFTDILKELGIAGTIHDCRHHVMTTCIKAGCCPTATDMLLGHVGMVGAGAVYNHSGNLPQMQSAWQFYSDWVARVCEIDGGDSGKSNVIEMPVLLG